VRALVDEHVRFVTHTLRKAGVPGSDLDDEIQRTFIAVAGRLDDVKPGAERSFLFQVAINMAAHARRRLARRREVFNDSAPERIEAYATPERLTERKQTRELLDGVLDGMPESLRAVFTLYEMEGMDRIEIAAALGIPRGTVASRLRRARAEFRKHAEAVELACDLGARGARIEGPALWRREKLPAVGRALLDSGTCLFSRAGTHTKTLAALGLPASAGAF